MAEQREAREVGGASPWQDRARHRVGDVVTVVGADDPVGGAGEDAADRSPAPADRSSRQDVSGGPDQDRRWLLAAIELSRLSPPSPTHYAVGAIIVDQYGAALATGYTGETDPHYHAEEAALAKLAGRTGLDLSRATVYTSMEPCTVRRSRPVPCVDLLLAAGVARVVLALREPLLFADCDGVQTLRTDGVDVVEIGDLGDLVVAINAHVLGSPDGPWSGRWS